MNAVVASLLGFVVSALAFAEFVAQWHFVGRWLLVEIPATMMSAENSAEGIVHIEKQSKPQPHRNDTEVANLKDTFCIPFQRLATG